MYCACKAKESETWLCYSCAHSVGLRSEIQDDETDWEEELDMIEKELGPMSPAELKLLDELPGGMWEDSDL